MQIERECQFQFGFFQKIGIFETPFGGTVIEKDGKTVCIYATDAMHGKIFTAIPMKKSKELAKAVYRLTTAGDCIIISFLQMSVKIDFSAHTMTLSGIDGVYGTQTWEATT